MKNERMQILNNQNSVANSDSPIVKLFSLSIHILNIDLWVQAENEEQAKELSAEFLLRKFRSSCAISQRKSDIHIRDFLSNKEILKTSFDCHVYSGKERGILACNLEQWFGE